MAFSISHAAKIGVILEFVIIILAIVCEVSSSWQQFNGPYALVRLKRAPQRAFTFSGFNPNNGITALATSADYFPPYYNYQTVSSLSPSQYSYTSGLGRAELESPSPSSPPSSSVSETASSDYFPDYQRPTSEYPSPDPNTDDRSLPSPSLTPPSEEAVITNYNQNSALQPPKKYQKKPIKVDDDDDDDDAKSHSKSTSNASFNAWFPIVLGMYPSRGHAANSNSYKEETENASSKNQYPDRYTDRELGNTVIANSVSHGKSSVASSHAIAYGGDPAMKSFRKGSY